MKKFADKICKYKSLILIVTGILMVISFIGMSLTKVNYDILVYLPEDIETIQGQNILTDDFEMGSYSVAIAKNMSSKEIIKLEDKIKNVKGVNIVVSLYDATGVIPVDILPTDITKYLHDDNADIFLITFAGGTSSEETINAVKEIRNLTSDNVKLGGMSSMVLDTMNLSNEEIVIYIIIAVILCIAVLEFSLDSYIVPILLLANIGIAILINMGTNVFLGEISYITKALVAVLQLGVTTDFSIFLYNSYEKKKALYKSKEEAMANAIIETFTSVIGSSLTTIAGFLVLCTMSLTLGKDLGIVMAKGVLIGLISTLLLFPALLLTFDKLIDKTKHKKINLVFDKLNHFIVKNYKVIFIIFVLLIVPAYLAYSKVDVYYKMDKTLPDTLESISANKELKDKFNIVSPEMIILDSNVKASDVSNMISEIKDVEGIDFALSLSELEKMGLSENVIPSDLLKIFKSGKYQMVLVNSIYEVASDEINNQITLVNDIVKKYDKTAIVAGEGPLMKDLIKISDTDFNNVNYSSILCVFIILIICLKAFALPVLLIITIEAAIFINMSIAYFGGVVLPFVAPIVLGTIQLGATIDYAILLTTTYKEKRKTMDKKKAMEEALNYCGASILISGLCFFAATFGVGVYSKLEMISSLCTLISRGAIISMVVVILALPTVLLTFDKLIFRKKGNDNMKNVKNKKIIEASFLALLTLMPLNTFALSKDETVYAHLNENGESKSVIVSEILKNTETKNELIDYSTLKDIVNKNGNETYTLDKNKLTWMSNGNDIYYEGKYQKSLPISMDITYKLDGKKVNAKDVLGQSGKVEIIINYKNNSKKSVNINGKNANIYTPFMIMYGAMLDSNYNKNVTINNGKVIANGNKNMVVGLAIPGLKESLNINELSLDSLVITYETTNFEVPTMYNVISNKLISDGNFNISKINTLYEKVESLQDGIDKINEGSKSLSDGLSLLKNTLITSLSSLDDNSSALTDNEVSYIKESAINSTLNTMKTNLIVDANGNVIGSKDENVNNIVSSSVKKAALNYLQSVNEEENLNTYLTVMTKMQNNIELSDEEKLFAYTHKDTLTILGIVVNASTISAKEVSTNISTYVAKSVAASVSESVAKNVADEVKKEAIQSTKESLNELLGAITKLDNGATTLNDGITKYNKEGISAISNIVNSNVKEYETRLNEINKLAKEYKTIEEKSISNEDETKFILVVDGQKKEETVKNSETKEVKTSLWTKIKNLFKKEN